MSPSPEEPPIAAAAIAILAQLLLREAGSLALHCPSSKKKMRIILVVSDCKYWHSSKM